MLAPGPYSTCTLGQKRGYLKNKIS
uniref:Uncharacterized protein n=1 Tax=Arundo donax TaxID=35708 RepID=A0A0A8Y3Y8_ARUDO